MIIILTLAVAFILSLVFLNRYDGDGDWDILFAYSLALSGVMLFIASVSIPLNRMGVRDTLAQVEAIRSTSQLNEMQGAAWRMKAADANAAIASLKYWNRTAFDIWIPDEVDSIEPLQ